MAFHPLQDLTADEIKQAAGLVRQLHRDRELVFKAITLEEPPKDLVLKYFKAQDDGKPLPPVPRVVFAAYYFKGTDCFITTYVNLSNNTVERTERMSPKYHGNIDFEEVGAVEELTLKDPRVIAEIAKLELPENFYVIAEAWGFGSDGVADYRRQYQVYMFVGEKSKPDSNHYARPLAFSPVVDTALMKSSSTKKEMHQTMSQVIR